MRLLGLLFLLVLPASAQQVMRVPTGFKPHLTLSVLTVTCTPTSASIPLVGGGVSAASPTIAITTTWLGLQLISQMNIYGYFTSSTQALSGSTPTSYIPSSAVSGQVTTGVPTSYTPFTQTGPYGGASASLLLVSASTFLSLGGTRTDNLTMKIDLSAAPLLQLPAAAYTGTVFLQAQVF